LLSWQFMIDVKITEHMSIPDQRWTVHFTWSPGATSCPLLLGEKKAENKFNATSRLPVCVCVCVCLCVCVGVKCYYRIIHFSWRSSSPSRRSPPTLEISWSPGCL